MDHDDDLERLVVAAHAVTRMAALETRNEAPAAQWRTLVLLRDNGPVRLGDLARQSRVTQPGMTRLVTQLTTLGYVERQSDDEDSRASIIVITPRGREAVHAWMTQLVAALRPRFDTLTDAEWHALATTADVLARTTRTPETVR